MTTHLLLAFLLATSGVQQEEPEPDVSSEAPVRDDTAAARAHFDAGRALYGLGHFDEALVEFEAAYAAKPLPKLLFNIGQCHFHEKRYPRATFFYERYLELSPTADNRPVIEGLIAEARRLEAENAAAAPAPDAAALTPAAADPPLEAAPEPPASIPAEEQSAGPTWLVVSLAVAVTVVALLAGSIAAAVWSAPPPPGTLGLVDRRTP